MLLGRGFVVVVVVGLWRKFCYRAPRCYLFCLVAAGHRNHPTLPIARLRDARQKRTCGFGDTAGLSWYNGQAYWYYLTGFEF